MALYSSRRAMLRDVSKREGDSVLRLVPGCTFPKSRTSCSTVLSAKNRGFQWNSSSPVVPNKRIRAVNDSVESRWYSFQPLNHHDHDHRRDRCVHSFSSLTTEKGYAVDIQGTIPRNGQGVEVGQYAQVCGTTCDLFWQFFPSKRCRLEGGVF
jgi:hypothetical protein